MTDFSKNSKDILKIISQPWCNTKVFKELTGVGENRARLEINQIRNDLIKKGFIVLNDSIPMNIIVEKLNIDIDYLKKLAEMDDENEK